MQGLIENENYNIRLRLLLWHYNKIKHIKDPTERRNEYDNYKDAINGARRQLQEIGKPSDRIVIQDVNDWESCTIIYKEPYEFDGTKDELVEYLWKNHALRIFSDYDCTGKPFTSGFIVGHLGGNLWKIGERRGLDV